MILVTGANGMVGSYVPEVFGGEKLYLTDIPEMDVTDVAKVKAVFDKVKPKLVLHLAAETDVDRCETEIDHAYRVNAVGAYNIALACRKCKADLVYIGTGGVFGNDGMDIHTEFDATAPLNVYAKAKLEGERLIQELMSNYYIFRAGWMIGGGKEKDKKFVGKIIKFCLEEKKELIAVDDKLGTPTFAKELVKGIKAIVKTGRYGLYHLGNNGICSRFDMAKEIVKCLGKDIKVSPVQSDRFPLPAPRARSEAMRNYKLDLMDLNVMQPWKECMAEYVREWVG